MKIINYGVVGCGYFGFSLAKALNSLEGANVSAIFDVSDRSEEAKLLGCDIFKSLDELVKSENVDAVIVATPNGLHKEPVIKAAMNKKHVFCEKPVALSSSDVSEMVSAVKENDVTFMSGHIMHFMNGVQTAKRLICEGAIGEIITVQAERTGWEDKKETVSWKKLKEMSGGHLFHHIHELDFICSLLGDAKKIHAVGGNMCHNTEGFGDEDDVLFIMLEFEKAFVSLHMGSAFHMGQHFVKINGTKGSILIDMQNVAVTVKNYAGISSYTVGETKEEDDNRTSLSKDVEVGITYGSPGKEPPLWLNALIKKEMSYFNSVLHGMKIDDEYKELFNGYAAMRSVLAAEKAVALISNK